MSPVCHLLVILTLNQAGSASQILALPPILRTLDTRARRGFFCTTLCLQDFCVIEKLLLSLCNRSTVNNAARLLLTTALQ
ncbi:hypothetical protein F5B17DRAFT_411082 [Nemania serpens]|nr:hypothetical protein F5B17DRAFT_411082 [Nemania serpens]